MEPVVIGAMGRIAAAVVQRSSAPVKSEVPSPAEWSEEADERGGLILRDGSGEAFAMLTQDQVSQISDFLEQPEVVALSQFMFIARLGMRDTDSFAFLAEEYKDTFSIVTEEHCDEKGYNWSSLAGEIWQLVVAYMESMFPDTLSTTAISAVEVARITSYVGATPKLGGSSRPANVAFRDVVDILGSPERFKDARNSLSDIRAASERRYAELNLAHTFSHAAENFRFDHEVLYVPRNLRVQNSDRIRNDTFLTSPTSRPRCVVIGNPGVGKSTMTQNLVHQLSTGSEVASTYAPFVISCKDIPNAEGNSYVVSAIVRSLRENLQLDVSDEVVNDLATLGRAFIIFDGIDEIIDLGRRQNFVKTIEAFAVRYPLTPILVTARRVGYSKARFNSGEFDTYELDDFSEEQVYEYTQRWFSVTGRTDREREAFLRETENVPDLCTNPLMLSLLCALYRARGYIPRNRRTVYESCADLLFQRWDAMRHIEQPLDHRQYGNRLMQELALFFHKSQTAQAGVQERQLKKLIAQFFTDTASVDENDARVRAQDFLDFCADRAWLLSYQGTDDRDQRIFGFTHRTFMEYFAAEAVVRRSRSLDEIVTEVAKAYERDASSVLADVIFQCADDKYDGGAREVVAGLMDKAKGLGRQNAAKYLSLCLRIMNSAPLPPHSTESIFHALLDHWADTNAEESYTTAISVFELSRDPRNRFISIIRSNQAWAEVAMRRWARLYWSGEEGLFDSAWAEEMFGVARTMGPVQSLDPPLMGYLVRNGLVDVNASQWQRLDWLLGFYAFGELVSGPLILDLTERLWGGADNSGHLVGISEGDDYVARLTINEPFVDHIFRNVATRHPEISGETANVDVNHFLIWACCVLHEISTPSYHPFHEVIGWVRGKDWFDRMVATRVNGVGRRKIRGAAPFSGPELQDQISRGVVPCWFQDWCSGELSFLPDR
ncbi:NACHT domain-containing protein [Streptomyces microflavus]|uniref:NACHT domain-containing protein n=1 Tax=Streptomyces microflavus TaxID=1919 RepID=UPI002E36928B|nr:NACHT domain-containing protein [Streptomyces microflavus]